jgi:ubiquitin carboxyl-terminal hydrolase 36/42
MSIKRYGYDSTRKELKKINVYYPYPPKINLDYLMSGAKGLDYILYAVTVHKGRTPNSGHYFCFINVTADPDYPNWYQFNDSLVRKAEEKDVL